MFRLTNPLPQALLDSSELSNFYREWNLVPYAGSYTSTGHSFLRLLCDLYQLSPSMGSCVEDMKSWAFEGDIEVVRKSIEGLKIKEEEREEVSYQEASEYGYYLEEIGIKLSDLVDLTQELFVNLAKTGNAWLHYVEVEINGQWFVSLKSLDPLQVMYLNTLPGEPRAIVFSKDFFRSSFQSPPRLIRVHPFVTEGAGMRETVFHLKNKRDHSEWYGRPRALQSLYWQFTEWSTANLVSKISNSEVGAKSLLLMQAPSMSSLPLAEDNDAAVRVKVFGKKLRKLTTNRGNSDEMESIGVLEYPQGVDPPKLETLEMNRDTAWTTMVLDKASDVVFSSNGWSKTLIGWERPENGIGGNVLLDEFKVKNASTIRPLQKRMARFWHMVLGHALESNGRMEFETLGIQFEDRITALLESMKGSSSATPQPDGGNSQDGRLSQPGAEDFDAEGAEALEDE